MLHMFLYFALFCYILCSEKLIKNTLSNQSVKYMILSTLPYFFRYERRWKNVFTTGNCNFRTSTLDDHQKTGDHQMALKAAGLQTESRVLLHNRKRNCFCTAKTKRPNEFVEMTIFLWYLICFFPFMTKCKFSKMNLVCLFYCYYFFVL